MDQFSIPERLDPISHTARTENSRKQSVTQEQKRRRAPDPPSQASDDTNEEANSEKEESHKLDELA